MSKRITPPGAGNTGAAGANEHGDLTEKYSTSAKVKTIFKHSVVCGSRFTPKRHNLHYVVNVGLMTKLGGLLSRSGFSWRRCRMC
ncbi:MAG: hypothetical protein AB2697_15755, partial [Candidatus Thiodiazotropha endolucinida]